MMLDYSEAGLGMGVDGLFHGRGPRGSGGWFYQ
jgi:hypothetical protein